VGTAQDRRSNFLARYVAKTIKLCYRFLVVGLNERLLGGAPVGGEGGWGRLEAFGAGAEIGQIFFI
jgi:hypothetical protein